MRTVTQKTLFKKVVLLDYCSEKNRGDAAMQVGLISLVQKYFSPEHISVVSVFGANQKPEFFQEYDHTRDLPVSLIGGLRPTFYPIDEKKTASELQFELLNAIYFFVNVFLLFLLVLRVSPRFLARFLPKNFRETLLSLDEADLIVWNGRNFRSRKNPILETYRLWNLVYHPLLCIALRKPIACIGGSVWKLNSPFSRSLMRFVFQRCFFVSIREKKSFRSAQALLGASAKNRLILLPDLSFAAFPQRDILLKKRKSGNQVPKVVGVTLVDWKSDGSNVRENYKKEMQKTLITLLEKGSKIVFVPQVTKKWENFDEIYREVVEHLPKHYQKNISLIQGEPHVSELLEIYSRVDFLIATRMHSAIFASAVGTPVIAIAYDSGGKWSILENLGYKEYIVPYAQVTSEVLLKKMSQFWKNKSSLLKVIRKNVDVQIARVEENIRLLPQYLQ